jgi:hypothetical protein
VTIYGILEVREESMLAGSGSVPRAVGGGGGSGVGDVGDDGGGSSDQGGSSMR